ncbi:MAG: 7-cyano-7-deazaguanine synthase QueC [Acidobacteria bacterium]|nr:7-cyano-7-deazaguanine synthase QueC [Acidobacteriota bacterium]
MVEQKSIGVVLLSGGMDSCVTAAIAAETHQLALVHASYGQRTEQRERRAFEEIADFYEVPEELRMAVRLEHFERIGGSALTDSRIRIPEREEFGREIPVTYVPFRNAHFLSVAVSWAEVLGAKAVFIGAVSEDSSGYPDCRPDYYKAFQDLVTAGTRPESQIMVNTPVIGMRKREIVRRGIELGAPLHLTWSCYQFEDEACGGCESCRLRLKAFTEAGIEDPIAYRARVER